MYCEPFAGLGNLYWKAALTLQFDDLWLNDIRTAPFFRALFTHGDSLEVPARSHDEFKRQNAAFKLGDPTSILLGPYFSRDGGPYDKEERQEKAACLRVRMKQGCACAIPL